MTLFFIMLIRVVMETSVVYCMQIKLKLKTKDYKSKSAQVVLIIGYKFHHEKAILMIQPLFMHNPNV